MNDNDDLDEFTGVFDPPQPDYDAIRKDEKHTIQSHPVSPTYGCRECGIPIVTGYDRFCGKHYPTTHNPITMENGQKLGVDQYVDKIVKEFETKPVATTLKGLVLLWVIKQAVAWFKSQ